MGICLCSQVWLRFASISRTWRGPKASWSWTKYRCWWSRWALGKGPSWGPWDHSTTCTTSWRLVLLHNHPYTHIQDLSFPNQPNPVLSRSPSANLIPCCPGGKMQAPRLLCNIRRGSQLWLVYCLPSPVPLGPGAWSLGQSECSHCWSQSDLPIVVTGTQ